MKKAPRLPSGCKFSKNSSCDFGLPSSVTSDTYNRDTHNDYCKKPSPRHIVIFFYSVVKTEVSLCVSNNCICREFFLYKLSTGHSNQYKRICGLDVRPPHKNIIVLVAGEVKKSVRSGSTVVGCDSSGRERCTVLQGHNEDIRDVRKVISGIKPPYFRGETLLKPDGSRRSYIPVNRKSTGSSKNSALSRIMSKKEGNDMDDQQYISVKEFASVAGISQQAVYKRLNHKNDNLLKYCNVINGKKMLKINALEDLYGISYETFLNQHFKQVVEQNKPVENDLEQDRTQELIDLLRKQVQDKDAEIEILRKERESDREKIEKLEDSLLKYIDQEQKIRAMALTDQKQETAGDQNTVKPMQSEEKEKEQEYNLFEPEQPSIWERIRQFFKGV